MRCERYLLSCSSDLLNTMFDILDINLMSSSAGKVHTSCSSWGWGWGLNPLCLNAEKTSDKRPTNVFSTSSETLNWRLLDLFPSVNEVTTESYSAEIDANFLVLLVLRPRLWASVRMFLPDKSVRGKWDAAVCSVSPLSCSFITERLSDETRGWTSLMNTWLHSAAPTDSTCRIRTLKILSAWFYWSINTTMQISMICVPSHLSSDLLLQTVLMSWRFKFKTFI